MLILSAGYIIGNVVSCLHAAPSLASEVSLEDSAVIEEVEIVHKAAQIIGGTASVAVLPHRTSQNHKFGMRMFLQCRWKIGCSALVCKYEGAALISDELRVVVMRTWSIPNAKQSRQFLEVFT